MVAIRHFGNAAAHCVPELLIALQDGDEQIRRQAAMALGSMTSRSRECVPALLLCIKDDAACVRIAVLRALDEVGVDAHDAVVPVSELLADENDSVREAALTTIGSLAVRAHPSGNDEVSQVKTMMVADLVVGHLLDALEDEDWCVRKASATAIGRALREPHMQEHVDWALEKLSLCLEDDDEDVRAAVATALGSCGKKAVPALALALADGHGEVRSAAGKAAADAHHANTSAAHGEQSAATGAAKAALDAATAAAWSKPVPPAKLHSLP